MREEIKKWQKPGPSVTPDVAAAESQTSGPDMDTASDLPAQEVVDLNALGQATAAPLSREEAVRQAREEGFVPEVTPSGEIERIPRRFRARTFFIPLLFGLLYVLIQIFSSVAAMFATRGEELAALVEEGRSALNAGLQELLLDGQIQNIATIIMALVIIPLYSFYIKRRQRRYPSSLLEEPLSGEKVATSLARISIAVVLVQILVFCLGLMAQHVPYIQTKFDEYEKLIGLIIPAESSLFMLFLTVVVLVPICEELLFRGIMMGEFMMAMNKPLAAILAALIFALFHGNFIQSAYVLIPGMVLGMTYAFTENIKIPIILHMCFNFLGGFLPTLMGATDESSPVYRQYLGLIWGLALISLIYLIIVSWRKRQRREA